MLNTNYLRWVVAKLPKTNCQITEIPRQLTKLSRTNLRNTKVKSKTFKNPNISSFRLRNCNINSRTKLEKAKQETESEPNQDELPKSNKKNHKLSKLRLKPEWIWTKPRVEQNQRKPSWTKFEPRRINKSYSSAAWLMQTNLHAKDLKSQNTKQNFILKVQTKLHVESAGIGAKSSIFAPISTKYTPNSWICKIHFHYCIQHTQKSWNRLQMIKIDLKFTDLWPK